MSGSSQVTGHGCDRFVTGRRRDSLSGSQCVADRRVDLVEHVVEPVGVRDRVTPTFRSRVAYVPRRLRSDEMLALAAVTNARPPAA